MKKQFLSILFFLLVSNVFATHNRAGEITYKHLGGLSFEITVVTYTDPTKQGADRCELEIKFGDGDVDTVNRVNDASPCDRNISCDCRGEIVVAGVVKKNIYIARHTYRGPGVYQITMEDPNRVEGIRNMSQSVNEPFYLQSQLVISPVVGYNSSAILEFPPLDNACIGQPYFHNPGAVDPDGDSLSFELTKCLGVNGNVATGYIFPNYSRTNNTVSQTGDLTIDASLGTVKWDSPVLQGIYNLCIAIKEWRFDEGTGEYFQVGQVVRDMQIEVTPCSNFTPEFITPTDLCVNAGDSISEEVVAFDRGSEFLKLSATGEALQLPVNSASFNQIVNDPDTSIGLFEWQTQCSHIRKAPYTTYFKVKDDNEDTLVNFASMNIRVVGPAPINPIAQNFKNTIQLQWSLGACSNVTGFNIYRKIDSTQFNPSSCEIGVPASLGYTKIANVAGSVRAYTDDNKGQGLVHGQVYCYRIVAVYNNEVEGYTSVEVCSELDKDVPVITRVSVNTTSSSSGSDTITWAKPTQLDSVVQYPGPYQYKIWRSESLNGTYVLAGETGIGNTLSQTDTVFVDENINTAGLQYFYKVELYSGSSLVGPTSKASSVYLEISATDNALLLSWNENVPWTNNAYIVYKKFNGVYTRIDTVNSNSFIDSGLTNGVEYSYFIESIGEYSTGGFINPILNKSQINFGIPEDTIAPCPPQNPVIFSECKLYYNSLSWENPNNSCADDVIGYRLYYTPVLGQDFELIQEFSSPKDTTALFENLESVAGCYAITAVDSFQNESEFSLRLCVDNCPSYELPNVMSPGGDGINDLFRPFPYRYVESIDLKIYNRWGTLVFESTDPDILWDGANMLNSKALNSGVYFYRCIVNEIRLSGIVPRTIVGNVTILNQKGPLAPKE